jgi:lipoprotein-anchoring transpeptidase ErfK/SrfK
VKFRVFAYIAAAAMASASPVAALAQSGLNLVLDRSERTVHVKRGGTVLRTYDVAVGKPGHATPTGSWEFTQVDVNPDWTPPDSDWSRDESYTPPGHADNPMGRVRMIFNMPYTIHGTDALHSIGKAASHGSVRMANSQAIELAELLLKEGGSWKGEGWYEQMLANPTEMYEIPLERPIPITITP